MRASQCHGNLAVALHCGSTRGEYAQVREGSFGFVGYLDWCITAAPSYPQIYS